MAYTRWLRLARNEAQNLANQKRHGVSFGEASEVFADDVQALEILDEKHSELKAASSRLD